MAPIKNKLATISFLDRQDYNTLTHHAIKLDELYQIRQQEIAAEKKNSDTNKTQQQFTSANFANFSAGNNLVERNNRSKLSLEDRNYRLEKNLCMYDGGNHPTHLCKKLIEKCKKEGKPLPIDRSSIKSQ